MLPRMHSSRLDAALDQDPFGAVVPDIHLYNETVPHHEAIDIAVALERRAVDPFAVERTDAVDHGLALTRADIETIHLLFDPAIAPRIEAGRPARVIELAPAREGDHRTRLHIGRSGIGIGDYRGG